MEALSGQRWVDSAKVDDDDDDDDDDADDDLHR